jgi:hypothetical protein
MFESVNVCVYMHKDTHTHAHAHAHTPEKRDVYKGRSAGNPLRTWLHIHLTRDVHVHLTRDVFAAAKCEADAGDSVALPLYSVVIPNSRLLNQDVHTSRDRDSTHKNTP